MMRPTLGILAAVVVFTGASLGFARRHQSASVTEPEFEWSDSAIVLPGLGARFGDLRDWQRPAGPWRVGLQVGHWQNGELPDELKNLRERGGGALGGGKSEWEVNLAIARAAKPLLESKGIVVDILPATVPLGYWADVLIAIHADGNADATVSGFKVAAPRRDLTGQAWRLVELIESEYAQATGLDRDQNVTRNMTGYYAFNWRRYEHAMHPKTVAVILETGFLTSPHDRTVIVERPERAALGIVQATLTYLGI